MRAICFGMICLLLICLVGKVSANDLSQVLQTWDRILPNIIAENRQKNGVSVDLVRYDKVKDSKHFSTLLTALDTFDVTTLTTKSEKLAFWINAYNIAAIHLIVERAPRNSIKEIGGLFRSVWNIDVLSIGGVSYSLAEIEHDILRELGEPRIHFAIVCASLSCPDLRPEAYRPNLLNKQLEDQTMGFLSNPTKGLRRELASKVIYISKIFRWFDSDFDSFGGVRAFLSSYLREDLSHITLKYLPYDWSLNGVEND